MSRLRQLMARVAGLLGGLGGRSDRLREELDTHLDLLTDENVRQGRPAGEARVAARRTLGNDARIGQAWREQRGIPWLESFGQDARHGLGMMRKRPGFTTVAIATLALGIGANAAIFSVVDAILLEPLPYPQAARLVAVFGFRRSGLEGTSYPNFETERDRNAVFEHLAGSAAHQLTLTGAGTPTLVNTVVVTGDYFALLGVGPIRGRTLLPEDCTRGAGTAVLLSEDVWRGQFGADPGVIGRAIALDKRPFTVVGVMPATFRDPIFPSPAQVWIPVFQDPLFGPFTIGRQGGLLRLVARMKPDVSLDQAQAEMTAIGARLAADFPEANTGRSIRVETLQQTVVGPVKSPLFILLGAVGLVLLIACVNIANLLLARATARSTEIGVRFALGAGRGRIVRQLLTESVLLALAGGLVGVGLAYGGMRALMTILPTDVPRIRAIVIDGRVLGFTLLVAIGAGLLFGLAPALLCAGADLQANLRESGPRSGSGAGRRRARSALAVIEVALAMVLLVGASLLIQSLRSLTAVNPGMNLQQVWKADVSLPQYQYTTPESWTTFTDRLLAGLHGEPGLQDVALAVPFPLIQQFVNLPFQMVDGPTLPSGAPPDTANYVSVSPDYFRVVGIPRLAGRGFDAHDVMTAAAVTIACSEAFVRRYFPGGIRSDAA